MMRTGLHGVPMAPRTCFGTVSRRRALAWLGALPVGAATVAVEAAPAVPGEVLAELPGARLRGQGRLTFFGLSVYDARLWVDDSFRTDAAIDRPLALELVYARKLHGHAIADRSLAEMRRASPMGAADAERWLAAMRATFADVSPGDRMTGVHRPGTGARFFLNGDPRGEISDAAFARAFFAIWLGPATSEPALRQALLGLGA